MTKNFIPIFAVLETTIACNMRCRHCGTAAGKPRQNELSTSEIKNLIDELAGLGTVLLTFTGGEFLLRQDWFETALHARSKKLDLALLTNGIDIDKEVIKQFKRIEPMVISVSIDGVGEVHDEFRAMPGAFEKSKKALERIRDAGLPGCSVTTITNQNIHQLPLIRELMIELDVWTWQIQFADAMGRMSRKGILTLEEIKKVAEFVKESRKICNGKIEVVAADCFGYGVEGLRDNYWSGCQAGITLVSVRSNGNVVGCLSLPENFDEENIRKKSLSDIWRSTKCFVYNRQFKIENLEGKCRQCDIAKQCRGGCRATALSFQGHIREYPFCLREDKNERNKKI